MTSNTLVVRNPGAATSVQPAQPKEALSDRLAEAQALAKAGNDILPDHYSQNPGAIMLAVDWAERHQVALFDVIQHVSFKRGRVTVSARLQKELAAREGFYSKPVEEGGDFCTVAVYNVNGDELGRFTYTLQMAESLGLPGRNSNWAKTPDQMLYHRATTRALDRYAHGPGLATVFAEEEDEQADVDVLEQAGQAPPMVSLDDICKQYDLNVTATAKTRAEAMARGIDDLSALTDDQAAEMAAWVEAQLGGAS